MKKNNEITEYDVNLLFIKMFALFLLCFVAIIIGNYFLEKSKINLANNNKYAYCTNIYKDFKEHGDFIGFVDHCMLKNK